MSESTLHLKLDRILAGQDQILSRITEQDETTAILTATLATLNDSIGTQTEVINRLAEALSEEAGSSDLHEAIKSIATSLKQIKEDGANMHVMLGRLAPAVAQAAQDAVFMAMGDGVDIPPEAPT
jgi:DNA-binding transcriptional regulator GbsR (MarR family)